ncbi:MAG: hypothetical protein SFV55_19465 [Haliscomenobacter sp.]|uniref:hypothetical protein n=1 Tax=Haliscomenobacter sp. TaxID=2717303 RepID=UPI0029A7D08C|nr:hypothetical protein [Haliscomenobacter sp.]MDX2070616.1 hypothetical protein [Haliscomenobacter sp.]
MEVTFNIPNWEKISGQTANFFYSESEKRLKELLDACNQNQEVAHRMLNILLPIITLTVGYLFSQKWNEDWALMLPATIFILFQVVALMHLFLTIRHGEVNSLGSNPRDMLKANLIIEDDERAQYLQYVIGACEEMQKKIDHNRAVNNKRATYNNRAMLFSTVIAPLGFIITSLVVWGFAL